MTGYAPFIRLFLRNAHSVALAANGHILVLDSSTGLILHSTQSSDELSALVEETGEVVAASVDDHFKYLLTATSNKTVRTWEIARLSVVSEKEVPKKPTDVHFTRDAQTILVSDKFGDVHRYPLQGSLTEDMPTAPDSDVKGAKKRLKDVNLLLGHVSLLTTFLLSNDEKYIITADRDEHIRISWYPEAYTIESFCLGHRKFVSALHILPWDPSLLISGGGDPELKIWNWMEGRLLHDIAIGDAVMPFVKVTRKKPGRSDDGSDGEAEGAPRISSRAKRRNKKMKKDEEEVEPEPSADVEAQDKKEGAPDAMDVDKQELTGPIPSAPAENVKADCLSKESDPPPLLVIQKISTVDLELRRLVVFSAHCATALFYFEFPESSETPEVRSVCIGQPILDFSQWPDTDEIWVAVDGNWSDADFLPSDTPKFVRIVKVSGDELILTEESDHLPLANSLNTTNRVEAPKEAMECIDLYSALVVLPKNLDVEHNAMDSEVQLSEANTKQLSGKELGRLKTKKAVLALQTAERGKTDDLDASAEPEDRGLKRQKSNSESNDT